MLLRPRYAQYEDPRYGCLVPRPHPLQAATWLNPEAADASVLRVIPEVRSGQAGVERLTFTAPIGAVRITVPTDIAFDVEASVSVAVNGSEIVLNEPATEGQELTLVFCPVDGRRGGALLNGPLAVEAVEGIATLRPWAELGLGALGGAVRYRSLLPPVRLGPSERLYVNLGTVRGTAEVSVDGRTAGSLFGGPWRVDVSHLAADGAPHSLEIVVRGTLAPYLQYASPTLAVVHGQTVLGLFGPVDLETWRIE